MVEMAEKMHEQASRDVIDATRYRAIRYGVLNNVEPDYTGPDVPESTLEEQMEDFDKVADSMVEKVVSLGVGV